MGRKITLTLVFGAAGLAVLLGLGIWQVQRLEWKRGILADIEARIAAAPSALPAAPDPQADRYRPVTVTGRLLPAEVRVLASTRDLGPGHRIVTAFETEGGRRILLDRGFLPLRATAAPERPDGPVRVTGNLHWPDEVDGFTPDPDGDLWFARDVPALARALDTAPLLVVARATEPASPPLRPLPVDTAGIPNDHLQYAITWFSLAIVWAGMTAVMVRRMRRGA